MERAKGKMPRKQRFAGDLGELKALLDRLGYRGEWLELDENGKNVFQSNDGALLNWWATTKTLHCQGRNGPKLQKAISAALVDGATTAAGLRSTAASSGPSRNSSGVTTTSERVFVVHGHDQRAREQLELVLHQLGLKPFVLAKTGGQGLTIIEALEKEMSPSPTQCFGLVLLTPDDMGYRRDQGPERAEPRARQNVVLEMGMLMAAFGRQRVAILKKPGVVVPSDASGIIYLEFKDHIKETVPDLCDRLADAGFMLEPTAVARACK